MGYRLTGTKAISINLRSLMRRRHREESIPFVTPLVTTKSRIDTNFGIRWDRGWNRIANALAVKTGPASPT